MCKGTVTTTSIWTANGGAHPTQPVFYRQAIRGQQMRTRRRNVSVQETFEQRLVTLLNPRIRRPITISDKGEGVPREHDDPIVFLCMRDRVSNERLCPLVVIGEAVMQPKAAKSTEERSLTKPPCASMASASFSVAPAKETRPAVSIAQDRACEGQGPPPSERAYPLQEMAR